MAARPWTFGRRKLTRCCRRRPTPCDRERSPSAWKSSSRRLELPAVAVDPQRFGLALGNLLDNALTYTDEGGRITLSASAVGEDRVRFTVADTGLGIPPEYLPHVFEKFFRVPGRRAAGPGWDWPSSARSSRPTTARSAVRASRARGRCSL